MYSETRWVQRFQNFEKAFASLEESNDALKEAPLNKFIRDSLILRYEYSIELAWKTIKDYLENQGFTSINSPKKAVRSALNSGLIKNPNWIKALNDRNKTSHAYNEDMAEEVKNEIQKIYIPLLQELNDSLKEEIISTDIS